MSKETIDSHIQHDIDELDDPNINSQRRRHLEIELDQLMRYKDTHPNEDKDPTGLDLYCNDNPNAPECRIHDI
jgi:CP12 domain